MEKFKKKIIILLALIIGSFACFYGFTFAKYISSTIWDYHLQSKGFYFTSDYLGNTNVKNVNSLWTGDSVSFNLTNSLNESVATGFDINYSVTCEIIGEAAGHAECQMTISGTSTQNGILSASQTCINTTGDEVDVSEYDKATCELEGYTWINEVATQTLGFDIVLTDMEYTLEDVTVNIVANSTAPYSKSLYGQFKLHKIDESTDSVSLGYDSYTDYDRLVVSNSYDTNQCVTIYWNATDLRIDEELSEFADYTYDANGYINQVEINIDSNSTKYFRFYKTDFSGTYDVSDFTILESCGT